MERIIGRYLEPHEQVHHKDEDKNNNDPLNLELCTCPKDHYEQHAYDDEELIRWLIQYADEFGRLPSKRECDEHSGMPNSSTFRRHFGSWSAAKYRAQLQIDYINYSLEMDQDEYIVCCG